MVAFIDNQLAVIHNNVVNLAFSDQALDQRHVDQTGGFPFPAANRADYLWGDLQKGIQPFDPLVEQFSAMHQNQRVTGAMPDQRRCNDRLAADSLHPFIRTGR